MFRTKKRQGSGRKRRDVETESEKKVSASCDDVEKPLNGNMLSPSDTEEIERDLHLLENLRRRRSRASKSAMTFSSKCPIVGSSGRSNHASVSAAAIAAKTNGVLSFDDGEHQKQRKMRANWVASSTVDEVVKEERSEKYTAEILSLLKSKQSVLLPSLRKEQQEDVERQEDIGMHEVDRGNDEEEMSKEMEKEDEEYIALEGGRKKMRYSKNRVTFGEYTYTSGLPKTTEIIEELSAEEEDEDQNKRWEEELMRRGGHRVLPTLESKEQCLRDGLPAYPTRKQVACVSLGSILAKLESRLDTTIVEGERVSRELVRLKTETALIETTVKQQQEELLNCSEEFEYFQEMEDFVKGLSFCLREKLPIIQAREQKVLNERVRRVKTLQLEEINGIEEELRLFVHAGVLHESEIFGLNHVNLVSNGDAGVESGRKVSQHALRMHKYRQHYVETHVVEPSHPEDEDVFADATDKINALERVYGQFQEWKAKFPEVYENTYCQLAQEKVFAPYVKAELLYWDPLSAASAEPKCKSLNDFTWFRVLNQHVRQSSTLEALNGPMLYQIRDVLLKKVKDAVSSYFDPYSSLQVRSLLQVLEELHRHGYSKYVDEAVKTLVDTVLETFFSAANCTVLVAIDQNQAAAHDDVNMFARYLLARFNALQDNLLTLFVALPTGPVAGAGFQCLLQVFHRLLAYCRFCRDSEKTQHLATATRIVSQLAGSSNQFQILSEPSQELELKHMIALFTPFLPNSCHQMN